MVDDTSTAPRRHPSRTALAGALLVAGVGVVVALFLTVGLLAAGTGGRLGAPGTGAPFVGTWLQLLGQVAALVAGVVALAVTARHPART